MRRRVGRKRCCFFGSAGDAEMPEAAGALSVAGTFSGTGTDGVSAAAVKARHVERRKSMIRVIAVPFLEVEGHAEADREDVDLEVHHARVAVAHGDLVVNLLGMVVGDTHHADVHLDGHVVGRKGHDAR